MRQARLRFHDRVISRVDTLIEDTLIPALLIMSWVMSLYNMGGFGQ